VAVATDTPALALALDLLLEPADQQHLAIQLSR
jgi:hypothetical protein